MVLACADIKHGGDDARATDMGSLHALQAAKVSAFQQLAQVGRTHVERPRGMKQLNRYRRKALKCRNLRQQR